MPCRPSGPPAAGSSRPIRRSTSQQIKFYIDLGFNHLVFHAPGNDQRRFLDLYADKVHAAAAQSARSGMIVEQPAITSSVTANAFRNTAPTWWSTCCGPRHRVRGVQSGRQLSWAARFAGQLWRRPAPRTCCAPTRRFRWRWPTATPRPPVDRWSRRCTTWSACNTRAWPSSTRGAIGCRCCCSAAPDRWTPAAAGRGSSGFTPRWCRATTCATS